MKPPCKPKQNSNELRPADPKKVSRAELDVLLDKVSDLVRGDPRKAAIILTDWLKQPAQKTPPKKKAG